MPDYKLISADSHMAEHPAAWARAQKEYPDRAPRVVKDPPGLGKGLWILFDENISPARSAYYCLGLVVAHAHKQSTHGGTDEDAEAYRKFITDYNENFTYEANPGGWEPSAYLANMDIDGIEACLLFSSPTRYNYTQKDAKFQRCVFNSYNEWLIEFASHAPKRLYPVPLLSILDVDLAVKDIHDYARRGIKTVQIPTQILGSGYYEPIYEPLWAAAQDAGVVLNVHHNSDQNANRKKGEGRTTLTGPRDEDPRKAVIKTINYAPALNCISNLIFSGVFDRYSKLRLAVSEFKISWVAGLVQYVDYSEQRGSTYDPERNAYKRKPSEYFRDNIFFTFENDRAGVLTTPMFGEDNFMFASDYPHHVSTWPNSHAVLERSCQGLPASIMRKLGRDNANRVFNMGL
ncbi:MAG TPA: amidohydrolase family protein [Alphaproteobacteria bacterium]|jgi:predicted TIM-barrel fold metal-dependent hydrolase|nr:amidohydrolase family protein [Alphaproteobacteria bacterium]